MLIETAGLSGAILLIIGAATGMAWALTQSGFSASLATFMTGLPGGVPMGAVANCVEIRFGVVSDWVRISGQAARSMH
jgi:TRAP-type C4-dicarboxylate transport system permease large subunit